MARPPGLCPFGHHLELGGSSGEKALGYLQGAFLEWALEMFSGYAAVDELYDGPYCVLSAVDNRQYKRVIYEVLDHDANHDDSVE